MALAACIAFQSSTHAQTGSSLTVTVADAPHGSSIPQGAQRVQVLQVRLEASCGKDVPVHALTVHHEGRGLTSDFLRVYASYEGTRNSRGFLPHDADPLRVPLRGVKVPSCGSADVTLFADFSGDALPGGEHRFVLDGVATPADVTIRAASALPAARVTPRSSRPEVTVAFRPVLNTVTYGPNRVVARLLLQGGKTADQELHAITFTNNGSARDADLRNFSLLSSAGEILSLPTPMMNGRVVRVVFDPAFLLRRNQAVLVQLRADVRASYTRTIEWEIEEPSDVEATETRRR